MLRRDRDLFEDSLLTYASGLSPDSRSGAVRRLRPFRREKALLRIPSGFAALRFSFFIAFTVLTHSPLAAWLRGVRARQRGAVSNWFIFDYSTVVVGVRYLNWDSWDFVLVVGWVAEVDGLVGVRPCSAPGIPRSHRCARSRPLTLREGGDCSLVVWFVLVVWLVGQV